ncbi:MAG: hypothetical protein JW940_00960 [Polyangiaceae bacterium]|nr:hypothetical protein [Polyangiaceae bacterium]
MKLYCIRAIALLCEPPRELLFTLDSVPAGGRTTGNTNTYAVGTVNQWLVPLIGGSGGAGYTEGYYGWWAAGGGAGGGAILIASSVSIAVSSSGTIRAYGGRDGNGNPYNGGAGGSIRLVAPVLGGNGRLEINGGNSGGCSYSPGRIRLEAFTHNEGYALDCGWYRTVGTPYRTFVPTTPPPSIRVVGIANMSVPPDPTGSFELPDVVFNFGNAIDVLIEARYVPPGTDVKLHLYSTDGADQIVTAPALQGTLEQSTTAVSIVFPPGFSRGFAHVAWE